MDFLDDFDFGIGDVDLSLVYGKEEDNLLSEICKEFVDGGVDLDQFDNEGEDDSSTGRGGLGDACKYGMGKRLECILRPKEENHDIDDDDDQVKPQQQHVEKLETVDLESSSNEEDEDLDLCGFLENYLDDDDQAQPQQQHVEKLESAELESSLNEEDEDLDLCGFLENYLNDGDDDQAQPQQQHVVEKPGVVELKSLNEEELERKLEASKKKLHTLYREADLKRSKRTVQVLDLKDCPDLKRSKKCVGDTIKRCWVLSSHSSSSSFSKKKATSSRFRGGRMRSYCK